MATRFNDFSDKNRFMRPLGYALLILGALCGYLVWRTNGKPLLSVFIALTVPLTVLGVIHVLIYGGLSEDALKTVLLIGVLVALATVVILYRGK